MKRCAAIFIAVVLALACVLGLAQVTTNSTRTGVGSSNVTINTTTVTGGSANQVLYTNSSGALGGSDTLTFDGNDLYAKKIAYFGSSASQSGLFVRGNGNADSGFFGPLSAHIGAGTALDPVVAAVNANGAIRFYTGSTPRVVIDGSSGWTEFTSVIVPTNGMRSHLVFSGTAPTISACGSSPPVVAGNDNAMLVTVGTGGAATSCAINFAATWSTAPVCHAQNDTDRVAYSIATTTSAVTITATAAFTASSKFHVICMGY